MAKLLELFEVKIRLPGDRITANGKKVEGGKVVSRHYFRRSAKQAEDCAKSLGIGSVIGSRKVHKDDIIGDLTKNKELRLLVERPLSIRELQNEQKLKNDVIVQDVSLSDIVFGRVDKNKRVVRIEQKRVMDKRWEMEGEV
jgi:hypothetical protein